MNISFVLYSTTLEKKSFLYLENNQKFVLTSEVITVEIAMIRIVEFIKIIEVIITLLIIQKQNL
jgi:hypothetical protein